MRNRPTDDDRPREPLPPVAELLLARIDSEVSLLRAELDYLARMVAQLEPDAVRPCVIAIEAAKALLGLVPERAGR